VKHVVVGVSALLLGAWGLYVWFDTFGMVMRGLVPILLVVFGLVALLAGYKRVARPAARESLRRRAEREVLAEEEDEGEEEPLEDEELDEDEDEPRKSAKRKGEDVEDEELDDEEPEDEELDDEEPEEEVRAAKR
jgi:flagellar biosynthesis/type III secretory pathway M-ring protein FliF/YscJ